MHGICESPGRGWLVDQWGIRSVAAQCWAKPGGPCNQRFWMIFFHNFYHDLKQKMSRIHHWKKCFCNPYNIPSISLIIFVWDFTVFCELRFWSCSESFLATFGHNNIKFWWIIDLSRLKSSSWFWTFTTREFTKKHDQWPTPAVLFLVRQCGANKTNSRHNEPQTARSKQEWFFTSNLDEWVYKTVETLWREMGILV